MIQIILSLLSGVLLLGLMLYWWLQGDASGKDTSAAWDTLCCLRTRLPVCMVDRILDYNDFLFVRDQKEPRILELLETERKAIAMYWLRHTRQQVKLLMAFHVKSAGHVAKVSPAFEVRLAFNYLGFALTCSALQGLIWMRGPFNALKVARYTMTAAARFCAASEKILMVAGGQPRMQETRENR